MEPPKTRKCPNLQADKSSGVRSHQLFLRFFSVSFPHRDAAGSPPDSATNQRAVLGLR